MKRVKTFSDDLREIQDMMLKDSFIPSSEEAKAIDMFRQFEKGELCPQDDPISFPSNKRKTYRKLTRIKQKLTRD